MSKCKHWDKGACVLGLYGGRPSPGTCHVCPQYDGPARGAGDVVHKVAKATGLDRLAPEDCGGCEKRRQKMNRKIPFMGNEADYEEVLLRLRRIYEGKPMAIIGGGPSLKNPEAVCRQLHSDGYRLMGANDAFKLPHVRAIAYGDTQWIEHWRREVEAWDGIVLSCATQGNYGEYLKRTSTMVMKPEHRNHITGLGWYTNTGAVTIQIAVACKPKEILLFGYDGKMEGDNGNWHVNEIHKNHPKTYERFVDKITQMMLDFEKRGDILPPIYNCNMQSVYQCFDKKEYVLR